MYVAAVQHTQDALSAVWVHVLDMHEKGIQQRVYSVATYPVQSVFVGVTQLVCVCVCVRACSALQCRLSPAQCPRGHSGPASGSRSSRKDWRGKERGPGRGKEAGRQAGRKRMQHTGEYAPISCVHKNKWSRTEASGRGKSLALVNSWNRTKPPHTCTRGQADFLRSRMQ